MILVGLICISTWLGKKAAALLQMSSVVKKEQSCLRACLPFASFPCPLKTLLEFQKGQLDKPSGQDFPCVLSNLCFTGKTLRPLPLPHISLSARSAVQAEHFREHTAFFLLIRSRYPSV